MSTDISTIFVKSNEAYNRAEYADAIKGYEEIAAHGHSIPDVYLNLGNAHMKSQHLGNAIFYYKKALGLSPRDPDVRYNLKYAREKTIDRIDPKASFSDVVVPFTSGEYLVLLAIFSIVIWSAQFMLLYRKWTWPKIVRNIFIVAFILVAVPFSISLVRNSHFGVITHSEVNVYSAIGKDNVVLFTLHEGTEFDILEKLDQWVLIQLADGKKGWVSREKILDSILR
ncbi:MAG: SH3 domain-containing protein [Bdellovibrio sp.]|nr:SH3 domain-containing protein [Bdellovibrio sp.]